MVQEVSMTVTRELSQKVTHELSQPVRPVVQSTISQSAVTATPQPTVDLYAYWSLPYAPMPPGCCQCGYKTLPVNADQQCCTPAPDSATDAYSKFSAWLAWRKSEPWYARLAYRYPPLPMETITIGKDAVVTTTPAGWFQYLAYRPTSPYLIAWGTFRTSNGNVGFQGHGFDIYGRPYIGPVGVLPSTDKTHNPELWADSVAMRQQALSIPLPLNIPKYLPSNLPLCGIPPTVAGGAWGMRGTPYATCVPDNDADRYTDAYSNYLIQTRGFDFRDIRVWGPWSIKNGIPLPNSIGDTTISASGILTTPTTPTTPTTATTAAAATGAALLLALLAGLMLL